MEFWVSGIPRPQGSKRAFVRPGGKVAMVEMSRKVGDWRSDVRAAALLQAPDELIDGAIRLTVKFVFPRPKSHYYTGKRKDVMKPGAPPHVTRTPDISKLLRAVEDALESVIYKNDSQIAHEVGWKMYGKMPGARVIVDRLKSEGSSAEPLPVAESQPPT